MMFMEKNCSVCRPGQYYRKFKDGKLHNRFGLSTKQLNSVGPQRAFFRLTNTLHIAALTEPIVQILSHKLCAQYIVDFRALSE